MPADLDPGVAEHRITLLETLDRVLNKGVVIAGDVTISVADVDLIFVGLRLLLSPERTHLVSGSCVLVKCMGCMARPGGARGVYRRVLSRVRSG
ncbi:MAG: gas vesicle protein, partial [candidate division NC10 bacterium]|nr:gas vesicle protein [candidate division NC10 bacterium]